MTRTRRPQALCRIELSNAFDLLRQDIARTDALVSATVHQLERFPWNASDEDENEDEDEDDGDRRLRREHVSHLLGAAKESARAAVYLGAHIAAELAKRGAGS